MFWIKLLTLAGVGSIIGWVTNVLAIKLIFRPLQPVEIPIVNMKIQGLIPKRKKELAKSVGEIVETELISMEEIIDQLIKDENKHEIIFMVKRKIKEIVDKKLPTFIPSSFKGMIDGYINDMIEQEGDKIITELTEKMIHTATNKIKISEIIEDKINDFELEKLEEIVLAIAKKELKHIEILGAVLGCIIGLMQGIIIFMI
ncbi:DUF445 domain-containing protein [Marinisporobacter balticus]|uniref:Uncharacterized protein DUF445 n=1 Tax=Marinisporobacter balticus TaxID=2018667 RepID=A0A4R2KU12_9FIRM|nr:DUF445 family protein [Marinisporobacter balticus]TCO73668.1 uncharacterized protein DUF445 [Marinisporobacter balticus]